MELAGNLLVGAEGAHAGGDLVVVDQPFIEAGTFSLGEHGGEEVEVIFVGRAGLGNVPDLVNAGLGNAVLRDLAVSAGHLGNPGAVGGDGRAGGNIAEVLLDFLAGGGGVDVSGKNEHGIGGAVIGFEPLLDVAHGGGVEVVHGPDDGPGIGVAGGVGGLGDEIVGESVGLVFTLALLVLHDAALEVEGFLIDGSEEVAHAVGLEPEGVVQGGGGDVFEVVGAIGTGGAVEVCGSDGLHGLDVAFLMVLAAAEHEVLEEMGEAGLAGALVLGAHVVPDVDGDDGRLVVLVDDEGESVFQDEFLVGHIDGAYLGVDRRTGDGNKAASFTRMGSITSLASIGWG